jgi:hypothetical protein
LVVVSVEQEHWFSPESLESRTVKKSVATKSWEGHISHTLNKVCTILPNKMEGSVVSPSVGNF